MKLFTPLVSLLLIASACKTETKKDTTPATKIQPAETTVNATSKGGENTPTTGDMIAFKGGTILIGSNDGLPNEKPAFEVQVAPFQLDKNLVSVADFRKFINATGYLTEADKFGDSGVFLFDQGNWILMKGANWEYPLGENEAKAQDNYPVTHISWNDAKAYASWAGKRLPTEYEYEFAAKNGGNTKYPWGDKPTLNGKHMANVWQGASVQEKEAKDSFLLTSPIGHFGESPAGLTDIVGNVWQWCEDVYGSYPGNPTPEPQDPKVRSTRGGSFMFDQALEASYTTTFRSKNSADTSLFNTGFRCAK